MRLLRVEESIEIERAIEDVFAAVTDPDNWTKLEGGARFEAPPELAAGGRIQAHFEVKGEPRQGEAVISSYEPPHRFGVRASGEPVNGTVLASLAGDERRTALSVAVEFEPSRWVFGLSFALGGRWLRPRFAKAMRLKLEEFNAELESDGPRERA